MHKINNIRQKLFPSFKAAKPLELQVMEEVSLYTSNTGRETLKILKNDKDITKYFDVLELERACSINFGENMPSHIWGINFGIKGKMYNMKKLLKNSVYIHSHPEESPLSHRDVISAIEMKVKKMIAVTPSLKYTSIEFDSESRKAAKENLSLFDSIPRFIHRIKKSKGKNWMHDDKSKKIFFDVCLNRLIEFSKKCGLTFESTL